VAGSEVVRASDVEVVLDDLRRVGVAAVVDGRGTGRSTLLDAVAVASGRDALFVAGHDGLADVPLGALAAAVALGPEEATSTGPGSVATGSVGTGSGDAGPGGIGSGGDAAEVARLVAALVGDRRGLLVVDDAHLLHPRDLSVLASVRGTGVRVLLSASDESAWPTGLDGVLRGVTLHRVTRLDVEGVRDLCDRVAGGTPDRARTARLVRLSGGRPGHVLRLLGRERRVVGGLLHLPADPATTDEAVAWYRLRTGTDASRRLARLVVREPAPTLEQLADLVGPSVVDRATDRGLVGVTDDRVELRDPLVVAVAAGHDRRVHGAGDAQLLLEVLGTQASPALVHRWRAEAGLEVAASDLADVVAWTVGRGRPVLALRLADRAGRWVRAADGGAAAAPAGEAELAAARAVALTGAGRHEEAMAACEALLDAVTGPLAGRVALLLADLRFFRRGDAAGALAALASVGADDPLWVDAEAMRELVRTATDPSGADRSPPAAETLAPTPRMLADLLAVLAGRVHGPQDVHVPPPGAGPPGVPVYERALANRHYAVLVGHGCAAARPVVEGEVARVLETGRPGAVALALYGLVEVETLEGRLVDAERTAREALSWTEVDDEAGLGDLLLGLRAGLLAELGRLEDARALLDAVAPRLPGDLRALLLAGGGRVRTLASHDRDGARAVARETVEVGMATGHVLWALRVAVDAARVGLAADVVDLVGGLADDDRLGALPRADAAVVRALADGGGAALTAAADACAAVGRRRVAADLLLARLPVPEERRRRAASLLDGLGPPHPDRAGQVEALTGREDQVARLASAGLSSRDVAGRLGVSVRTVDNHLRRAYRKLGVHGREELATVLGSTTVT